jgi:AcrR family transcriptional regulator
MGRRARVSREQVLRTAREAFAETGYHGTTLTTIASRLGLSAAALLRHAPGKRELFTAAMTPEEAEGPFPVGFLAEADGGEDPRVVLRRLAETAIPFIESQLAGNIACWMYAKTAEQARTIRLPFDPRSRSNPPRRAFGLLEGYLRRASRAGRLSVRDPRAAALTFMGAMNAYVFFHRVIPIVDPPLVLDRYVDTLLEIWTRGTMRRAPSSRGRPSDARDGRRSR